MKVIDTFPFNGDWIIKMRLELMFPWVDEFVITESWYTFSGVRKDCLYKDQWEDILRPYQSKIHWIILDEYSPATEEWCSRYRQQSFYKEENKDAWFNEHSQRDIVVEYIQNKYKEEDYLLHVADVDEIPKVDIFHPDARDTMGFKLNEIKQPLYLEMLFFYYNFYWQKPYHWYRAYLIGKSQLKENPSLSFWRLTNLPQFVLRDAGWHCSYFMDIHDIQRKVHSFSHREYDDDKWTAIEHIKECIAQGKDLFDRKENEHLLHVDDIQLPPCLSSYRGELDYIQMS